MPTNALSIDAEEWYHPELIRRHYPLSKENLINDATAILLNLLYKYKTRATFFVVGEVAAKNPQLIRKIYENGHEIAFHGFSHQTLQELGQGGLRKELTDFKQAINNILNKDIEIKGFRAPTFSLNAKTAWAIDILKEFSIKYDSSIFPVRLGLYGVRKAPLGIYGLNSRDITTPDSASSLKEFPLTAYNIAGLRLPIAGGFYLRLIPINMQKIFLRQINKNRPFIIYIHPWECDKNTPRINTGLLSYFISYYNIKTSLTKLEELLKNFRFDRIDNILGV